MVAAAARGEFVLIVLGIGLSLPIVVWGAGWLARLMNRYAWIVYFDRGVIVRVRAYLDSVMVARLFAENPIT